MKTIRDVVEYSGEFFSSVAIRFQFAAAIGGAIVGALLINALSSFSPFFVIVCAILFLVIYNSFRQWADSKEKVNRLEKEQARLQDKLNSAIEPLYITQARVKARLLELSQLSSLNEFVQQLGNAHKESDKSPIAEIAELYGPFRLTVLIGASKLDSDSWNKAEYQKYSNSIFDAFKEILTSAEQVVAILTIETGISQIQKLNDNNDHSFRIGGIPLKNHTSDRVWGALVVTELGDSPELTEEAFEKKLKSIYGWPVELIVSAAEKVEQNRQSSEKASAGIRLQRAVGIWRLSQNAESEKPDFTIKPDPHFVNAETYHEHIKLAIESLSIHGKLRSMLHTIWSEDRPVTEYSSNNSFALTFIPLVAGPDIPHRSMLLLCICESDVAQAPISLEPNSNDVFKNILAFLACSFHESGTSLNSYAAFRHYLRLAAVKDPISRPYALVALKIGSEDSEAAIERMAHVIDQWRASRKDGPSVCACHSHGSQYLCFIPTLGNESIEDRSQQQEYNLQEARNIAADLCNRICQTYGSDSIKVTAGILVVDSPPLNVEQLVNQVREVLNAAGEASPPIMVQRLQQTA